MVRRLLAEFIGTFALVFAGTGAIVANDFSNGAVSHVGIAITFGLVVMIFIYALAEISGAHFNPAVSFSFLQLKKLKFNDFILYVLSQLVGGILASFCIATLFPPHPTLGMTLPHIPTWNAFGVEVLLTFFLVFVILQVTNLGAKLPSTAGLAIGSTVALDALFGGQLTGASMNPARSFAPALVAGNFSSLWIYIFAPLIGAIIATWISSFLLCPNEPQNK